MINCEKYIVNEQELELLKQYEGIMAQKNDKYRYDSFEKDTLVRFCLMKDRSNDLYFRRYQAARDVIDMVAKEVGIDPENTSLWLYAPDADGGTPILNRIKEWVSRSGEKAQLKKKLHDLEQENAFLRTLIRN